MKNQASQDLPTNARTASAYKIIVPGLSTVAALTYTTPLTYSIQQAMALSYHDVTFGNPYADMVFSQLNLRAPTASSVSGPCAVSSRVLNRELVV